MKITEITLAGQTYYLYFNGVAMFALQDIYGDNNVLELLSSTDAKGFDALCKVTAILAEQGELMRRYQGHDKGKMPTENDIRTLVMPIDIIKLKYAAMEAMLAGYGREIKNEDEEIDVGLLELQKKKEKP